MLTQQHRHFFETFGYLKLPQAMAPDIGWIQDEFESVWRAHPEISHDGSKTTTYPFSFITATPRLSSLLEHPLVEEVVDGLLGAGWSNYGGEGSLCAGDTGWHSDVAPDQWEPKSITRHIKVHFYLDELKGDTGALRVIPGSHTFGDRYCRLLQEQAHDPYTWFGDVPGFAIENVPGDLIIFDHRIKHASFGGTTRRRRFCFNVMAPCSTPEQTEAARKILRDYRDQNAVNWTGGPGWLDWISTLSERSRAHHELVVRLGREVMAEMAPAAS